MDDVQAVVSDDDFQDEESLAENLESVAALHPDEGVDDEVPGEVDVSEPDDYKGPFPSKLTCLRRKNYTQRPMEDTPVKLLMVLPPLKPITRVEQKKLKLFYQRDDDDTYLLKKGTNTANKRYYIKVSSALSLKPETYIEGDILN